MNSRIFYLSILVCIFIQLPSPAFYLDYEDTIWVIFDKLDDFEIIKPLANDEAVVPDTPTVFDSTIENDCTSWTSVRDAIVPELTNLVTAVKALQEFNSKTLNTMNKKHEALKALDEKRLECYNEIRFTSVCKRPAIGEPDLEQFETDLDLANGQVLIDDLAVELTSDLINLLDEIESNLDYAQSLECDNANIEFLIGELGAVIDDSKKNYTQAKSIRTQLASNIDNYIKRSVSIVNKINSLILVIGEIKTDHRLKAKLIKKTCPEDFPNLESAREELKLRKEVVKCINKLKKQLKKLVKTKKK